jgi:hypothetical protein
MGEWALEQWIRIIAKTSYRWTGVSRIINITKAAATVLTDQIKIIIVTSSAKYWVSTSTQLTWHTQASTRMELLKRIGLTSPPIKILLSSTLDQFSRHPLAPVMLDLKLAYRDRPWPLWSTVQAKNSNSIYLAIWPHQCSHRENLATLLKATAIAQVNNLMDPEAIIPKNRKDFPMHRKTRIIRELNKFN